MMLEAGVPAAAMAVLLTAWLLISAVRQLPLARVEQWGQHDQLALIPRWNFFAPRPATHDFHLLYRDTLAGGGVTAWQEVRVGGARSRWAVLWNPGKRERKALYDFSVNLLSIVLERPGAVQTSVPYLALLNHVTELPRSTLSEATQFMLMAIYPAHTRKEPDVLFVSSLHPLEQPEAAESWTG